MCCTLFQIHFPNRTAFLCTVLILGIGIMQVFHLYSNLALLANLRDGTTKPLQHHRSLVVENKSVRIADGLHFHENSNRSRHGIGLRGVAGIERHVAKEENEKLREGEAFHNITDDSALN
jgi:hypothetical protein